MKKTIVLVLFCICACSENRDRHLTEKVDKYLEVYSQRKDFSAFLDFYSADIVLEDIINGDRIDGKEHLKSFFNWSNPDFKALAPTALFVSEKIISGDKAVVKGYFTPFQWGQTKFEPMHFTTILTFNDSLKIIRQVDWINYPSNLVDYYTRKNSNLWLK